MDITITPGPLRGTVRVPTSKSAAHRAAICAALAEGASVPSPIQPTQDMVATFSAAKALGATVDLEGDTAVVRGISQIDLAGEQVEIDCNESGSTLRFFVPIAAALGVPCRFLGRGQLPNRPMDPLVTVLEQHGVRVAKNGGEILSVSGKLQPGTYSLAGNISSQYITGLLFALPLLEGDSEIILTSPLQSKGYVDMTVQMQRQYGVEIKALPDRYRIPGGQQYRPGDCDIEGDYSAAAFWLCAGALGSDIEVLGLELESLQGDKEILKILREFRATLKVERKSIRASKGSLVSIDLDAGQIPDLIPAVAATAAFANGTTTIYNAARLRIKESDRLQTVTEGLKAMGAGIVEYPDKLVIIGQDSLAGGCTVDSYGDHRIAMAMSIAATACKNPVTVLGAQCVEKSYPAFYDDFTALGGICHVL